MEAISTVVMYHDLLGFGSVISNSGGRFDSALGELAYQRICRLAKDARACSGRFPDQTTFHHLNDAIVACLDIDIRFEPSFHRVEAGSGTTVRLEAEPIKKLAKFIAGACSLHSTTMHSDEQLRHGPGGRTFVVLGKRWTVPVDDTPGFINNLELQANIAFAEAYHCDAAGSKQGFERNGLYYNDAVHSVFHFLKVLHPYGYCPGLFEDLCELKLELHGSADGPQTVAVFERAMFSKESEAVDIEIFHQAKRFFPIERFSGERMWEIPILQAMSALR